MKKATLFLVLILLNLSCKSDESDQKHYFKAVDRENTALLELIFGERYFYGQYEVRYGESGRDFGEVRGIISGDTLIGKFKYISFGGSKKIAPFVLLKHGKNLKLASGSTATYMNIPYYTPETLAFKDSDFQFYPIDAKAVEKLKVSSFK